MAFTYNHEKESKRKSKLSSELSTPHRATPSVGRPKYLSSRQCGRHNNPATKDDPFLYYSTDCTGTTWKHYQSTVLKDVYPPLTYAVPLSAATKKYVDDIAFDVEESTRFKEPNQHRTKYWKPAPKPQRIYENYRDDFDEGSRRDKAYHSLSHSVNEDSFLKHLNNVGNITKSNVPGRLRWQAKE